MRLALALGGTVAEIKQRMSVPEFIRWKAYDRLYGLPDRWSRTQVATQVKDIKDVQPLDETTTPAHRMTSRADPDVVWGIIVNSAKQANNRRRR